SPAIPWPSCASQVLTIPPRLTDVRSRQSLCLEKRRRRRFGRRGRALRDPVKIVSHKLSLVRLSCTPLGCRPFLTFHPRRPTFLDGCYHTNRLVRRYIQSMGWMSARLDGVRPLLCGGAFMALRVARR